MEKPVLNWMQGRTTAVKSEFSLPWGICDLVGVSIYRNRARKRVTLGQRTPLGPARRVRLLESIPDESEGTRISISRLEKQVASAMSTYGVRNELDWLQRHGFVKIDEHGRAQKINGWAPLHRRILAIELKLKRVQEALEQASAHRRFADESYVALPAAAAYRAARSERRNDFWDAGVGLLAVWTSGCRTLLPVGTNRATPDQVAQMHVVERFWRSHEADLV